MCEPTWRSIGIIILPMVDMRFVAKARANTNAPLPGPPRRLPPPDFLALVDGGQDEEPPPAA